MELPTLTAPHVGEPLTLYISASDNAIGAVLLMDRKTLQTPIYYVSRTLTGPETRYSMLEKLFLALVYAAKRLRGYFQGHPINVVTGYKLKNVLSKPELSRRLAKWSIELGEHAIEYKPRPAIKGQVLADIVTVVPQNKEEECLIEQQTPIPPERDQVRSLFTDGASKYEAFLAGMRIAKKLGVKHLEARVDSMLIAEQINGTYEAKNDVMASYLSQAKDFTFVAHPHANGQVERANRSIKDGIKARLGTKRTGRVDELPHVLWAFRTQKKSSNSETPFSLTYGTEAMIPAEIGVPSARMLANKDNEK
ncbi:uncharacterized protein LOC143547172 [Bidens hawaiensis]|uniref:uncharacterized protein LOC143547172 n=1 Tax=Bidens hawaiensis TaxID=980011 RepID=UPI00404B33FF